MFKCERCGSAYNGNYIGVESCPRCLLLDRVQSPLSFKMFQIGDTAENAGAPQGHDPGTGREADQRVRSAR